MAKKTSRRGKKRAKTHPLDLLPKHSQQRRSPGGQKRRTDFSFFFCSSSISTYARGLLVDASNGDRLSSAGKGDNRNKMLEVQGLSSSNEFPDYVETAHHNAVSHNCNGRNIYEHARDMVDKVKRIHAESQIEESDASCTVPGSLIWAKNSHQQWWPAKVLGERSSSVDSEGQGLNGYVLVQYYGNNESAWVDPTTDVSLFDSFFEERSCIPMKEFQDALQQALQQREIVNSRKQLRRRTPTKGDSLPQTSESPDNKWDSSRSSRTESDCPDQRRRGKRERKPRVHFDEVSLPVKPSTRASRRIRIMRFLGLAAPIGSPFTTLSSL